MTTESSKKKILVVEDEELIAEALRTKLTEAGFEVIEARNGVAGVVQAFEEHPDLIMLDILMPLMDGWQMLKEVREKDAWGKCVPVVILTNLSADEDAQIKKIAELGPSYFMVKADWKVEGVADKVKEILSSPLPPCP